MNRRIVALDVGGSSVKSALVRDRGIPEVQVTALDTNAPREAVLQAFADIVTRTVRPADSRRPVPVAIGFPGPFDYAAGVCYIRGLSKYKELYGVDIAEGLKALLEFPAVFRFRNDAEAAILGEAVRGAARNYRRILGVTLGTGMGSSFIENRIPVSVPNNYIEDGSLFPVPATVTWKPGPNRDPDRYKEIQLETGTRADDVFSTRGVLARLAHCTGRSFPAPREAAEAANKDRKVRECFQDFGRDLGVFLTHAPKPFPPDAVLVLGGISHAADLFIDQLQAELSVPVITGILGPAAPLLGAAELFSDYPDLVSGT